MINAPQYPEWLEVPCQALFFDNLVQWSHWITQKGYHHIDISNRNGKYRIDVNRNAPWGKFDTLEEAKADAIAYADGLSPDMDLDTLQRASDLSHDKLKPQWIEYDRFATDNLPTDGRYLVVVNVLKANGTRYQTNQRVGLVGDYNRGNLTWIIDDLGIARCDVTHYMPLPELPE